jgi:hypothetical protein
MPAHAMSARTTNFAKLERLGATVYLFLLLVFFAKCGVFYKTILFSRRIFLWLQCDYETPAKTPKKHAPDMGNKTLGAFF